MVAKHIGKFRSPNVDLIVSILYSYLCCYLVHVWMSFQNSLMRTGSYEKLEETVNKADALISGISVFFEQVYHNYHHLHSQQMLSW